jgi:CDP-glycerol glycerophosphotransferase (TagB/SpsB family)
MDRLVSIAKVCHIPYGYAVCNSNKSIGNIFPTVFNKDLLSNINFFFADGDATYNYCKKRMWISELIYGRRLYNIGYPRFDNIPCNNEKNEKYIALWIPRWTDNKQIEKGYGGSTFFKFKDSIIDYAVCNQENFKLIIRPHPLAFENYIKDGKMTKEEVNRYKEKLGENDIILDEKASYVEALCKADVLIADYSSIIIEFFLQGKPIIYCGDKGELSPYIKRVTDTFYYAKDWLEVQSILNQLSDGSDTMMKKRKIAVESFKNKSSNNAGGRILQVLIKDYKYGEMRNQDH